MTTPASTRGRSSSGPTHWVVHLAVAVVALIGYGLAYFSLDPIATGDEPSYYLIAKSIVADGDVDLANQYGDPTQIRESCPVCPLDGPVAAIDYRDNGKLRPYHYTGLPILIAPSVAIVGSPTGPRLTVLALSVLAAWLLFVVLGRVIPRRPRLRLVVWAAVAFSMPLTVFSSQIYPEMVSGLFILCALTALTSPSRRRGVLIAGGMAVAYLPWLHIRLLPIAAALALMIGIRAWRASDHDNSGRRLLDAGVPTLPLVASLGLVMLMFNRWYGSPAFDAAYNADQFQGIGRFVSTFAYRNFFGALFNPTFGLLPWAPVMILGVVGLGLAFRRSWWVTTIAVGAGLAYLVAANALGVTHGASPPARYEIVIAFGLAIPLALVAARWATARVAVVGLAGLSLILTIQATRNFLELFPAGGGGEAVTTPGARELAVLWPRFLSREAWVFTPDTRRRVVGRVSTETPLPPGLASTVDVAPTDGPGLVSFGYGTGLAGGRHRAQVDLARSRPPGIQGNAGIVRVLTYSKVTAQPRTAARTILDLSTLPADGAFHTIELPFRVARDRLTDVTVATSGRDNLRVGAVRLIPEVRGRPPEPQRYQSVAAVSAWTIALLGGIAATALLGTRARSRRPNSDTRIGPADA